MKNLIIMAISGLEKQLKYILFLLMFTCSLKSVNGQVDMGKYYRPDFSFVNPYDFLRVEFAWDMTGNIQAHLNQAINSLEEKNAPGALGSLDKAIELDSNLWISHYYRGVCNKQLLRFKESEGDFLKVLSLKPSLAEAHIELAELYIIINVPAKAKLELKEAIKKNGGIADSYLYLALVALLEKNITEA